MDVIAQMFNAHVSIGLCSSALLPELRGLLDRVCSVCASWAMIV